MQSELKPCPFCSEQCAMLVIDQGDKWAHYEPSCLEVRTGYDLSDDAAWRAEAIAAWNTRASDAEITRLTEAKALVERLRSVDISWSETGEWCAEAADRIEQLEREKAVVSDLWEQQKEIALGYLADCNKAADRIAALEADNARLREALEWYVAEDEKYIRAALGGKQ